MIVEQAYVGAIGVDTDTKLDAATAGMLCDLHQVAFVVRYLSIGSPGSSGDLDADETSTILGAGLALMAVQHVLEPGWSPTAELGTEHGSHAVANAVRAGLPQGVTIWNDLEGVKGSVADTIAYVNAKHLAIRQGGYDSGLYVGAGQPLDEGELYSKLDVSRYWHSLSEVPNVSVRGYTMIQLYPTLTYGGIQVDLNVVQKDKLGGLPRWVKQEPTTALLAELSARTEPPPPSR